MKKAHTLLLITVKLLPNKKLSKKEVLKKWVTAMFLGQSDKRTDKVNVIWSLSLHIILKKIYMVAAIFSLHFQEKQSAAKYFWWAKKYKITYSPNWTTKDYKIIWKEDQLCLAYKIFLNLLISSNQCFKISDNISKLLQKKMFHAIIKIMPGILSVKKQYIKYM